MGQTEAGPHMVISQLMAIVSFKAVFKCSASLLVQCQPSMEEQLPFTGFLKAPLVVSQQIEKMV